jgi:glycosyltransferase involved in cell wall biosynthesis
MTAPAALLYDDSAYVETASSPGGGRGDAPLGLVGRLVAGREFLDAYLTYGTASDLPAVVWNQASAASLADFCERHPSAATRRRTPRVVPMDAFLDSFAATPPAPVLYTPCPPDPSFAWARLHRAPGAFALSGVTHTICSADAARALCNLLIAPYETYDALICTSSAVARTVRAVTGAYADYLRDRLGAAPALRPRLATIPLGVNPERFRPATPAERASRRAALNVADDAVAFLFVGRFTPHAKAHPFPMFHGLARAVRETGRKAHLLLSGWAPNGALLRVFLDGLKAFAPGIPVSVIDGTAPDLRFGVWQAADVFTSLADSIQETFGLVVIEAMASGLPVVASDWDGYRDLVADGETGLLVPTWMVRGATADTTARLLLGAVDYDGFLAECNQAVTVDPEAAAAAYGRLLTDGDLRRRMGEAGRRRVLERFTWERVVRAYEELWREQDRERRAQVGRPAVAGGPPCYPAPEVSFAGYPTRMLDDEATVRTVPGAENDLGRVLALPLCNYMGQRRVCDEAALRGVLAAAAEPRLVGDLTDVLRTGGVGRGAARATLAWLLKYGLLRVVNDFPPSRQSP